VFALGGDRENQVRLNADHKSLCGFNPAVEVDTQNYFLVRGNVIDLVDAAVQTGKHNDWYLSNSFGEIKTDVWEKPNINSSLLSVSSSVH